MNSPLLPDSPGSLNSRPPLLEQRRVLLAYVLAGLLAGLLGLGVLLAVGAPTAQAQLTDGLDTPLNKASSEEVPDPNDLNPDDLMASDDPSERDGSGGDGSEPGTSGDGAEGDEGSLEDTGGGVAGEEEEEEEEDAGGSSGGACKSTGPIELISGGADDVAVNTLVCMLEWVYDKGIQAGGEEISEYLARSAFGLPSPEGEMLLRYEQMVTFVKPGILVGILALGILMMVQSANYNVAYGTQTGLPKLAFAAAALIWFPDLMRMVSDLSGSLATEFIGEAELARALSELIVAGFETGGPLSVFLLIAQIAVLAIGALVVAVAILKNIFFAVLFIVGPLAMILSVVPGMQNVASAWIRGVIACAAIPLLYSLEVTVGSWVVRTPELIFGGAGGILPVFKVLAAVALMYIMYKTPFKVLGWAFHSYSGGGLGSGLLGQVAKGVAISTVARGAIGALTGGPAGAASGAASGAAGGAAGGGVGAATAVRSPMQAMQQATGAEARNLPSNSLASSQADLMQKVNRDNAQARAIRSAPISMSSGTYSYGGQAGARRPGLGGASGGKAGAEPKAGLSKSSRSSGNEGARWKNASSSATVQFKGYRAPLLERKPAPDEKG